jgi:hypothetical protein
MASTPDLQKFRPLVLSMIEEIREDYRISVSIAEAAGVHIARQASKIQKNLGQGVEPGHDGV